MRTHSKLPLITVLMFALAACSSGGGDSGDDGSDPSDPPGDNGLPLGAVGQSLDDAEGETMTLQVASANAASGTTIGSGTVILDSGFFDGGEDATVTVLGETVTISNGTGVMPTGEVVSVIYDDDRSGDYAGALELSVSSLDDTNAEVGYVFGFETDPDNLDLGSINYEGGFLVSGFDGSDTGTDRSEYEGTINISVVFNGGSGGNADVTLDGDIDGATTLDLDGNNLALNESNFSGELSCSAGCTSSTSEIDATFYGPAAEEVGGVLAIETDVYTGAGTFVIGVD